MSATIHKVILIDDHELIRHGLRTILKQEEDIKVIAEGASGEEAIGLCKQTPPDVLILDISMPGMNGVEAAKIIKHDYPSIKILILSMFHQEEYIESCIKAGVEGYVVKNDNIFDISTIIRTLISGKKYLSPTAQSTVFSYIKNHQQNTKEVKSVNIVVRPYIEYDLTKRELEIIGLIKDGCSSFQIAEKLFISKRTVDKHRSNIMRKTQSKNTIDLVEKTQHYIEG